MIAGSSVVPVWDDTILDVDGHSDISSLSKIFPSDSIGASDNNRLISNEEGYRVIPTPNCDGVLDGGENDLMI